MFGVERLGGTLALAHYIGAALVGLCFRFYAPGDRPLRRDRTVSARGLLGRAVSSLLEARREDGRPLGQLLGDAVNDSVRTLLMICGFIVLFSVFVKVFQVVGIDVLISLPLRILFMMTGIDLTLVPGMLAGIFEIDLGTVAAAKAHAPLVQRALIASAIIAWSGLSVHGQVASVLAGTDIRMWPYVAARALHAVLAAAVTVWLMSGPEWASALQLPVLGPLSHLGLGMPSFWQVLHRSAVWALLMPVGMMTIGGMVAVLTGGVRLAAFHWRDR